MKSHQKITDKLAIGLSLACVLHCLALPIMLVLLPSLAALNLDNEAFHLWMVVAVIPSSIYALTMGCKQHRRYQLLVWGVVGLALLILALALGEERIGEWGEKGLTVLGATFVAIGHWFNFRLCDAQREIDSSTCCPD